MSTSKSRAKRSIAPSRPSPNNGGTERGAPARALCSRPDAGSYPDEDADWIREIRHELDALYLRALECYTHACLGVGGTELAAAERAGRELISRAPYRENGYRYLMRVLAQTGNPAEALRIYEQLRGRLRDELGIAPSTGTLKLHAQLLANTTTSAHQTT